MITIKVTNANQVMKSLNKKNESFITKVANDLNTVIKSKTPILKGTARRGWRVADNLKTSKSKSVKVQNNVPYINKLEAGSSKQAPRGFVKQSIREIRRKYR